MNEILINWILFFLLPAALTVVIAIYQSTFKAKLAVVHIGLAISIFLLFLSGARLQLAVNFGLSVFFILTVLLAFYLLSNLAIVYVLSSITQELSLLLAAILLSQQVGIIWGMSLTVLVFSLGHLISRSHWQLRLSITAIWGIFSIILYYSFHQLLLNFAIHIAGGAIMFSRGLLYGERHSKNRLVAKR